MRKYKLTQIIRKSANDDSVSTKGHHQRCCYKLHENIEID